MFYLLLLWPLLCWRVSALVTVLCNSNEICSGGSCMYLEAGCVLYDNGQLQLAVSNSYPITYHSGGFDGNGYHVEFYFGQDESVSIHTPNGNGVSMMKPAGWRPGYLYFAFNDRPLRDGANDARSACYQMMSWDSIALPCDDVYNEALSVYKPNKM